ncbi:MAG: ThiF family adenylyltransferase [Candidatus Nanoarchaeia archaeon]|nr:ThiF family adenylyltransferase [Candidatus Nanoarchaeia archaeon]
MVSNRIARQQLIKGWNQETLDEALLYTLGRGLTSRYATLLGSCLEIGRIICANDERARNSQSFMGQEISRGEEIATRIGEIVQGLNPNISVGGLCSGIRTETVQNMGFFMNYAFHSGNDWEEKRYLLQNLARSWGVNSKSLPFRSADEKNTLLVLGASNFHELRIVDYNSQAAIRPEFLMPQRRLNRRPQTTITSMACAALGLSEIVRRSFDYGQELKHDEVITWNLLSDSRTSHENNFDWSSFNPLEKRIGVIGCGAIGLMYLEATHDLGFRSFYIRDFDKWEISNFSRAPHCVDEEGEYKAVAARRHFNRRKTRTRYHAQTERFDEKSNFPEVDLLVSAVDGFDNQMRVINYSQQHRIPLLLGACDDSSLVVYAYAPGQTSSMLYQYDFLKQAYLDSIRRTHRHCTDPEVLPSQALITSLCAAILAGETVNLFSGHPLQGQFKYSMKEHPRFEYVRVSPDNDLGTKVPYFVPLKSCEVERIINSQGEEIRVKGKPFNQWYEEEGDILRRVK